MRARADAEVDVRLGQAQLLEEDLRHGPVVVLAGVDDLLLCPGGIERGDDRGGLDEVRSCADDVDESGHGRKHAIPATCHAGARAGRVPGRIPGAADARVGSRDTTVVLRRAVPSPMGGAACGSVPASGPVGSTQPDADASRKVWIDLTNSPHVLFFRPILRRLDEAGVETVVTARDFAQTLGLLQRYGIAHTVIGRHGGASVAGKGLGLVRRSTALVRFGRGRGISQAVSHGSNDLAIAARVLRCTARCCTTTKVPRACTASTSGSPTRS